MISWKKIVFFIICFLLLTACINGKEKMLRDYGGTYVGDASTVSSLVRSLLGGDTPFGLDLTDQVINVNYIYRPDQNSEPVGYWSNLDNMEKGFLFNLVYLTILVPNANGYVFNLGEEYSFSIARETMVEELQTIFSDFPTEDEMWDQERIKQFIRDNQDFIIELVENENYIRVFFDRYKIVTES
ncbi:DUF4825 domain-containing protein [Evansella tamaricis]|uniref:DUF4825 domain-containing protein n=1 Tax=Evansella tamaricis TaxID=2069301 RepID=A0ABS6JAZ6_9BACI|nr:DUF4825 domain-containing protein [Evansella tamaricis]MBU9710711.1 DUF4825 domain-containing protein [Evansella tamaricis]